MSGELRQASALEAAEYLWLGLKNSFKESVHRNCLLRLFCLILERASLHILRD